MALEIYIGIVAGTAKLVKNVSDSRYKLTIIDNIRPWFHETYIFRYSRWVFSENFHETGLY